MSDHAAFSAAHPNSSLKAPGVAIPASMTPRYVRSMPALCGVIAASFRAAFVADWHRRNLAGDSAHVRAFRPVSRPLLGVTLRAFPAPCGRLALLLRVPRPPGYGFRLRRTLRKCRASALGAGATRWHSPRVTRAGYGKFNETEITIMYQNKVTLIGFLGSDAEVRTNNDRSLTTLSLATKSSYKKDGKYIEHTEWHRCVVFGKLGEFAATLKKGAHIQVEGELRSRKYDSKKTNSEQTIWEIRVNSILKLDRAAKAATEDEDSSEEEAA
jgi:single-strand DNA-binding protein